MTFNTQDEANKSAANLKTQVASLNIEVKESNKQPIKDGIIRKFPLHS